MNLAGIKQLETEGRWAEIRLQGEIILASLPGVQVARGLIALAVAHEKTATSAAEYHTALTYARKAAGNAPAGSFLATWALHLVACYAVDLGLLAEAERAALGFLEALPRHAGAARVTPWVLFALGRVRHYQRRHTAALSFFRAALDAGAAGEIRERIQLHQAWTLAESGRAHAAAAVLPPTVEYVPAGQISAARAVVLAAAGDWQGAQVHALAALGHQAAGEWAPHDTRMAAELCLLLKRASLQLGTAAEAVVWSLHSAALLAGWAAGFMSDLLPTLRPEGGAYLHAADSHRGPAGHKRVGLLGAVG